jgi:hypothetical protein
MAGPKRARARPAANQRHRPQRDASTTAPRAVPNRAAMARRPMASSTARGLWSDASACARPAGRAGGTERNPAARGRANRGSACAPVPVPLSCRAATEVVRALLGMEANKETGRAEAVESGAAASATHGDGALPLELDVRAWGGAGAASTEDTSVHDCNHARVWWTSQKGSRRIISRQRNGDIVGNQDRLSWHGED